MSSPHTKDTNGAPPSSSEIKQADVVTIDYEELNNPDADLTTRVREAFGFEGLGILAVTNVPKYQEKRARLLPLAREFARLPEDAKQKYEHPESFYSFGWSHGKEQFEGKPDYSKGSYYANPLYDRPVEDEKLIHEHPPFYHPNIWPKDDVPDLEPAFKDLGELVIDVGIRLAKHCDQVVRQELPRYPSQYLTNVIRRSRTPKGRLLYYFPKEKSEKDERTTEYSSWCGWHNDHGSLTGLVNAMFFDAEGNEIASPDPSAGLYIKSRSGDVYHVKLPKNAMGFQIGESAQIHSGGILQATPHSVRAADVEGCSRSTLAVFMEPEHDERMLVPEGADTSRVLFGTRGEMLPPGVPSLQSRWSNDQDFGEFTEKTLKSYY